MFYHLTTETNYFWSSSNLSPTTEHQCQYSRLWTPSIWTSQHQFLHLLWPPSHHTTDKRQDCTWLRFIKTICDLSPGFLLILGHPPTIPLFPKRADSVKTLQQQSASLWPTFLLAYSTQEMHCIADIAHKYRPSRSQHNHRRATTRQKLYKTLKILAD